MSKEKRKAALKDAVWRVGLFLFMLPALLVVALFCALFSAEMPDVFKMFKKDW